MICGHSANENGTEKRLGFKECMYHAITHNSYAFAYHGTSSDDGKTVTRWCRLCDEIDFENRQNRSSYPNIGKAWGVYRATDGKCIIITHNFTLTHCFTLHIINHILYIIYLIFCIPASYIDESPTQSTTGVNIITSTVVPSTTTNKPNERNDDIG